MNSTRYKRDLLHHFVLYTLKNKSLPCSVGVKMMKHACDALMRSFTGVLGCAVTQAVLPHQDVPVLSLFCDGVSDARADYGLTRPTLTDLFAFLHDGGLELEALVFVFSASSYRVVSIQIL